MIILMFILSVLIRGQKANTSTVPYSMMKFTSFHFLKPVYFNGINPNALTPRIALHCWPKVFSPTSFLPPIAINHNVNASAHIHTHAKTFEFLRNPKPCLPPWKNLKSFFFFIFCQCLSVVTAAGEMWKWLMSAEDGGGIQTLPPCNLSSEASTSIHLLSFFISFWWTLYLILDCISNSFHIHY